MPEDRKQIELVVQRDRPYRISHIGLGLLASLVVGFGPLSDAFQGHGSFESAIVRFLACVTVSVCGAMVVGRLLDSAPTSNVRAPEPQRPQLERGSGSEPSTTA